MLGMLGVLGVLGVAFTSIFFANSRTSFFESIIKRGKSNETIWKVVRWMDICTGCLRIILLLVHLVRLNFLFLLQVLLIPAVAVLQYSTSSTLGTCHFGGCRFKSNYLLTYTSSASSCSRLVQYL